MNRSTPGLPVHHQFPEFTQTHVHRVGNAIQPSHPLSSSFPPAFNLSQNQGLFQRISSLNQVCQGPASAGSRGYPQDEWRRRERKREKEREREKDT